MSQLNPNEKPTLMQQLQADKTTLETMLADQREYVKLLDDRSDPLGLGSQRIQTAGQHNTYLIALENALDVLNSLLPEKAGS